MALEYRLLIVDDDAEVREAIAEALASRFQIITASDANDGFEKAQTSKPDAIVLDVMMPGRDGIALCKDLREDERTKTIPILMLTAVDDDDRRAQALIAGANDLVSKPVRPHELFVRLLKILLRTAKGAAFGGLAA